MGSERALWRYVSRGMGGRWRAQRHEDRFSAGVPDVSYSLAGVDGWLELKHVDRWPVRSGTRTKLGLTNAQRNWLTMHGMAGGGRCFVLAQVGRDYLLFPWSVLHHLGDPGQGRYQELLQGAAVAAWCGKIDFDKLATWLATGFPNRRTT